MPIVQGGMGVGVSLCGPGIGRGQSGRRRRHLVGRARGDLQRLFEGLPRGLDLGAEARSCARPAKRRRGIIGVNVMVAMSNFADMVKHRHRREGRHHLLGCRAAVEPAVVPHRRRQDQTGADRLVGPCGEAPVPEMVLGVQVRPRRHRGRGPQGGRPPGLQGRADLTDEHYSLEDASCRRSWPRCAPSRPRTTAAFR